MVILDVILLTIIVQIIADICNSGPIAKPKKKIVPCVRLFNYDLMSIWGQYVQNKYDVVSYVHWVLPKNIYFIPNESQFKNMFKSLIKVVYISFEPKVSTVELPVLFLLELKQFTDIATKIHEEELDYENNGNGFYKFTLIEDWDRHFN